MTTCQICIGHEGGYDFACEECNCHSLKPCGNPAIEFEEDEYGRTYYCAEHWDRRQNGTLSMFYGVTCKECNTPFTISGGCNCD